MVAQEELVEVQVMRMCLASTMDRHCHSCSAEPLHVSHEVSPHVYEQCVQTPTPHGKTEVL